MALQLPLQCKLDDDYYDNVVVVFDDDDDDDDDVSEVLWKRNRKTVD